MKLQCYEHAWTTNGDNAITLRKKGQSPLPWSVWCKRFQLQKMLKHHQEVTVHPWNLIWTSTKMTPWSIVQRPSKKLTKNKETLGTHQFINTHEKGYNHNTTHPPTIVKVKRVYIYLYLYFAKWVLWYPLTISFFYYWRMTMGGCIFENILCQRSLTQQLSIHQRPNLRFQSHDVKVVAHTV